MKITVLVKPVPYKSIVDNEGNVVRSKVKNIINKDDRHAIEEALRIFMKDKHITQTKMAGELGYKTVAGITNRLDSSKNSMRFDMAYKFANVIGCDLVLRDRENPEKEIVIRGYKSKPEDK